MSVAELVIPLESHGAGRLSYPKTDECSTSDGSLWWECPALPLAWKRALWWLGQMELFLSQAPEVKRDALWFQKPSSNMGDTLVSLASGVSENNPASAQLHFQDCNIFWKYALNYFHFLALCRAGCKVYQELEKVPVLLSPCPRPLCFRCKYHILCCLLTSILPSSPQDFMGLSWCPKSNKLLDDSCQRSSLHLWDGSCFRNMSQQNYCLGKPWTSCTLQSFCPKSDSHGWEQHFYLKLHKFSLLPWKDLGLCSCYMDEMEFGGGGRQGGDAWTKESCSGEALFCHNQWPCEEQ